MRYAGPAVFVATVLLLFYSVGLYAQAESKEVKAHISALREKFDEQAVMLEKLQSELEHNKNRPAPKPEPLIFIHLSEKDKVKPQPATQQTLLQPTVEQTLVHPELESNSITYEQCKASLKGKSAPKTLENLHWIHIPKTGTSFAWTLFSYLCSPEPMELAPASQAAAAVQAARCNYCGKVKRGIWDRDLYSSLPFEKLPYCDTRVSVRGLLQNHLPVPRTMAPHENFVALLRDPRRRLVSAYNHGKHSFGIGERHHATASERREYMVQHTHDLHAFASFPDIQHCQTKTMLSEYCAIDMNITATDESKALQRLSKFAFVGITEHFNLSVCLFHHMHGGPVHEFEFANFRVAPPYTGPEIGLLPGGSVRVPSDSWTSLKPSTDPHDWELFQQARRIFAANLRKYGLLK